MARIVRGNSAECAVCGSTFIAKAANQRTCSPACSTKYLLISQRERSSRSLANKARMLIWRRDAHKCIYCKRSIGPGTRCVDHIIPFSLGGVSAPENLVSSCVDCNKKKASTRLSGDVEKPLLEYARQSSSNLPWEQSFTDALDKQWRYSMYSNISGEGFL